MPSGYIVTKVQFTDTLIKVGEGQMEKQILNLTALKSEGQHLRIVQSFDVSNATSYPDFNYSGTNTLYFYFIGYPDGVLLQRTDS